MKKNEGVYLPYVLMTYLNIQFKQHNVKQKPTLNTAVVFRAVGLLSNNQRQKWCTLSNSKIGEQWNIHRNTVSKAIQQLAQCNLIVTLETGEKRTTQKGKDALNQLDYDKKFAKQLLHNDNTIDLESHKNACTLDDEGCTIDGQGVHNKCATIKEYIKEYKDIYIEKIDFANLSVFSLAGLTELREDLNLEIEMLNASILSMRSNPYFLNRPEKEKEKVALKRKRKAQLELTTQAIDAKKATQASQLTPNEDKSKTYTNAHKEIFSLLQGKLEPQGKIIKSERFVKEFKRLKSQHKWFKQFDLRDFNQSDTYPISWLIKKLVNYAGKLVQKGAWLKPSNMPNTPNSLYDYVPALAFMLFKEICSVADVNAIDQRHFFTLKSICGNRADNMLPIVVQKELNRLGVKA